MSRRKHSVTLTLHAQPELPKVETSIPESASFSRRGLQTFYEATVEEVVQLQDNGEYIAGPFMKFPSKKLYADYYDVVKSPISLHEIKQHGSLRKTKASEFPSLYEFLQQFQLMADNAVAYNGEDSLIAKDAHTILEFVRGKCEEFAETHETGPESDEETSTTATAVKEEPETVAPPAEDSDFSAELSKIAKYVINFKTSHHKNSTKLSLPFLAAVDGNEYPDYYKIVKKGMCFDQVEANLEQGEYNEGKVGAEKFAADVELIFSNACTYNAPNSVIYHDAQSLKTVFTRRMDKFRTQFYGGWTVPVKKRGRGRPPSAATLARRAEEERKRKAEEAELSLSQEEKRPRKRGRKPKKHYEEVDEDAGFGEEDEDDDNDAAAVKLEEQPESGPVVPVLNPAMPQFIRKHDVEKAESIDAVDDITAFIKRFTFSSAIKQYNSYSPEVTRYFEHCMVEPAGNSTVGGSTYSINLPAQEIMGQPLIVLVSLENRIIDERYTTELNVNENLLKPQPLTISYDNDDTKGEFVACKFEFKLGIGLNLFVFKLRVPYPLKSPRTEEERAQHLVARAAADTDKGRVTRSASKRVDSVDGTPAYDDDDDLGDQQFFQETVRVWVNVA